MNYQKSTTKFETKVKNSLKREFDGEPVYSEKYLIAKIKCYNGKVKTNFHSNKMPKESSRFIFILVNLVDSVFRAGKNYYPQVFSEECKDVIYNKKDSLIHF